MLPPNLINQIHPYLNSDVELIISATRGSKKRVWWLGECGHEWEAGLRNRAYLKQKCPYCFKGKVLLSFNDLRSLNLLRFATNKTVVGGFTKLLKHVERIYTPDFILTFSDHTVSDGGLYENNGFVDTKELSPDYMYVNRGVRVHKFNYRLKRSRNDPELQYDPALSERELAQLNNLPRIWDAGKTRWVKSYA